MQFYNIKNNSNYNAIESLLHLNHKDFCFHINNIIQKYIDSKGNATKYAIELTSEIEDIEPYINDCNFVTNCIEIALGIKFTVCPSIKFDEIYKIVCVRVFDYMQDLELKSLNTFNSIELFNSLIYDF